MRITMTLPTDPALLCAALEGLTAVNAVIIAGASRDLLLYESGVRYKREPAGREHWQTVAQVIKAGWGDCEDLAAWRAAELRVFDAEPARVVIKKTGRRLYHAVVLRANGTIEDPSKRLGLRRVG